MSVSVDIDWSHAPEWATRAAQDGDGVWYWYESNDLEASGQGFNGRWCTDGRYERIDEIPDDNSWRETLVVRPEVNE